MGFASVAPAAAKKEKKKESESIFESTPARLRGSAHVFLQFNQMDGDFEREIYIPFNNEIDGASYDPDKEETYCAGHQLNPGKYLLSVAIASSKLEKIGTKYFEFTIPSMDLSAAEITTSPVIFTKNIERIAEMERVVRLHQGYFTYGLLKVEPNVTQTFAPGEPLDVFFFIYGVGQNDTGQFSIEINYNVVKKGDDKPIAAPPVTYQTPFVSQPLPMKRTIVTTNEAGEEKSEVKDLEIGEYTLSIDIKDNVSGKTHQTSLDFIVK